MYWFMKVNQFIINLASYPRLVQKGIGHVNVDSCVSSNEQTWLIC